MRVALGGRETCVAEKFLDSAKIGSGLKHVRGKAVPERVRTRFLQQAQAFSMVF